MNDQTCVYDRCRRISLVEVARHSTSDDFWTVIDDVVYDMSGFTQSHPGGPMVLFAAGTDCTVLFHQYHLNGEKTKQIFLHQRRVGVFDGKSPQMGNAYVKLQQNVSRALRGIARRPRKARALLVLDLLCMCVLLLWSLCASTATPRWQLILAALISPTVLLRLFGQSHALGHMQICSSSELHFWGRSLLALGAPGIDMFLSPSSERNPRALLNAPRLQAQAEYPQKRGPAEHVGIHHVRGVELHDDECYNVASMFQLMRLSRHQKHYPHHCLQHYRIFQWLAAVFADLSLATAVPMIERIQVMRSYLIPNKLWKDSFASLIGIAVSIIITKPQILLLLSGTWGFCWFMIASLLKWCFCRPPSEIFFCQHVWDYEVDAATADEDWATHNAESSLSLRGLEWHPVCWGMGGACPSTLTYHLEHTLFPGINYLYLPKIAPIIDSTLAECGLKSNVIENTNALHAHFQAVLSKYSKASRKHAA